MNGFMVCNFCSRSGGDICEYRMWQKTDADDRPIDDYLITCKGEDCQQRIDDDPMLFIEVSWGAGGPGKFMLVCGDCTHRDGFSCRHPDLKANGGAGLEVRFANLPIYNSFICGSGGLLTVPAPASWCAGNPGE